MHPKNRLLSLVLGQSLVRTINTSRVLIVGAGGIGCELVKNLSKSGYKDITILDFDSIEITNLNRQFYFRSQHINKSKAQTVKTVLHSIDSNIKIRAINASIYDPQFNILFYHQFDLIFSCLDNMKAREHLAAQASKCGKAFIDAGTMSYYGQAYSSIRFKTSCHNCNPSHSQQTHAFCTIRSNPQLPVHCATYAKNFYDSFFGINQAEALSDNLKFGKYINEGRKQLPQEELKEIGVELFEEIFNLGISDVDLQGNKIELVRKLSSNQAATLIEPVFNPQKSTFDSQQHARHNNSPYKQQKLWSIAQYYQHFITSVVNLIRRKLIHQSPPSFQKDDEDCMTLVLCITNLRTYNFINYASQYNKHKYLTFYQCKDLIGKVFPAIASSNAIAAALQARQAINIIAKRYDKMRYISFGSRSEERLSPSIQSGPNFECSHCSEKIVYGQVLCDMSKTTFRELEQFVSKEYYGGNRDVSCGSLSIIKNSRKGGTSNKDKHLDFFPELIHHGVLSLQFNPQVSEPQYLVSISVVHSQSCPLRKKDEQSRRDIYEQLVRYFRKARGQLVTIRQYEMQMSGGHQL